MEKEWFYERLFLEVVIIIVNIKKYSIKEAMPIKIIFIHYSKWTRVMLPEVFEEFELLCILFCYFFLFTIIVNWLKVNPPPGFYEPLVYWYKNIVDLATKFWWIYTKKYTKSYSKPSRTSKTELFAKTVNGFQQFHIFERSSILDVWMCSEYASDKHWIKKIYKHEITSIL